VEVVGAQRLDLEALYATRWHQMVRLAVLLVDDVAVAEDVVQDAFVALHRHQARLRNTDAASDYLRTSVVNGARSELRKRAVWRRHLVSLSPRLESAESADRPVIVAAEHADLIRALRRLPRRQREVLVLRYWSHLSEADIARTLGVSPGTVKSTASRGLDALESMLGGSR
jgi:RNA polymerase sigma-70 factor (sigma-E family)